MHTDTHFHVDISEAIDFKQFLAVDIRIGKVVEATRNVGANKPSYVLMIDFGDPIGMRKSSAQITETYDVDSLVGKLVAAVVNLQPRQVGKIMSQVLTLGFPDANGAVILCTPDREVPIGSRLF